MKVGMPRNTGASAPFKNNVMEKKKKIIDPCGHAAKIAKQNKEMPKPIKEVMN